MGPDFEGRNLMWFREGCREIAPEQSETEQQCKLNQPISRHVRGDIQ